MAKIPKGMLGGGGVLSLVLLKLVDSLPELVDYIIHNFPKPNPKPARPDQSDQVIMPDILDKQFCLTLPKATELLENFELKVLPVEVSISEAHTKYAKFKDYSHMQVIGCSKKAKTKLKVGDTIIVQYITQEVIDESRLIFEKTEREKADAKLAKIERRAAQMEKLKNGTADTMHKATEAIGEGAVAMKDGVKKLITRDREKNKEKENLDE
jgi:hypothetical protein